MPHYPCATAWSAASGKPSARGRNCRRRVRELDELAVGWIRRDRAVDYAGGWCAAASSLPDEHPVSARGGVHEGTRPGEVIGFFTHLLNGQLFALLYVAIF